MDTTVGGCFGVLKGHVFYGLRQSSPGKRVSSGEMCLQVDPVLRAKHRSFGTWRANWFRMTGMLGQIFAAYLKGRIDERANWVKGSIV
jgi:hypothetical protein